MGNEQILNVIVQFGSFGVLVVIILWVGRVLVPNALSAFREQGERFAQMQERQDLRHEQQLAKRDAQIERLTDVVDLLAKGQSKLADRIEELEERTAEHRPVK